MGAHYKERIAETSMSLAFAKAFVEKRREQEKQNMLRREKAIGKGLIHESYAAKAVRGKR
jgi:hypothetical protein